jgi:hypothetical protein
MPIKTVLKYLIKSDMKSLGLGALVLAALIAVAIVTWMTPQAKVGKLLDNVLNPDNAAILAWSARSAVDGPAVTIVDIDDRSFHAWDQPPVTPRRELAGLVDAVLRRSPAMLVVDVDITGTQDSGELDLTLALLERLAADKAGPVIVLMRRLWSSPPFAEVPSFGGPTGRAAGSKLARIEEIVEGSDRLIWASALHGVDGDGLIRKWRLAEAACNSAGRVPVRGFLTPYVIVAALLQRPATERHRAVSDLKSWARAYAEESCRNPGKTQAHQVLAKVSGGRLAYRSATLPLPYHHAMFDREGDGFAAQDDQGRVVRGVLIHSAAALLASEPEFRGSRAEFCAALASPAMGCGIVESRIALIGASHLDSRDIHITPLGPMAGIYIVANGILGAKAAIGLRPWYIEPAAMGAALFVVFWAGIKFMPGLGSSFVSTLAIALICGVFVLVGGWLGLDAGRLHESILYALAIYAFYLLVGWFLAVLRKLPAAWRLLRSGSRESPGVGTAGIIALAGAALLAGLIARPGLALAQSDSKTSAGIVERIESWDGKPAIAMVLRGADPERRLVLGEHVLPGDRIRAPNADTTIVIKRVRGIQEICKKNQEREACTGIVQAEGGMLRNPTAMWRSVRDLMRHYGSANAVNMATRSADPPVFRFDRQERNAPPRPQRLIDGKAPITLVWSGGAPPFAVKLLGGASGNEILAESRVDGYRAVITSRLPLSGLAQIEVAEIPAVPGGPVRKATLAIEIVNPPLAIPDFAEYAPDPETRTFLAAIWLAQRERGAFLLAALQLLEPIADRHPPSAALRAALRMGDRPE